MGREPAGAGQAAAEPGLALVVAGEHVREVRNARSCVYRADRDPRWGFPHQVDAPPAGVAHDVPRELTHDGGDLLDGEPARTSLFTHPACRVAHRADVDLGFHLDGARLDVGRFTLG